MTLIALKYIVKGGTRSMHPAIVGLLDKKKKFKEAPDGELKYKDRLFTNPSIHYYVAEKGRISRTRSKRTKALWQKDGGQYFFICVVRGCGQINGVENDGIDLVEVDTSLGKGLVTTACIVCPKCSSHNFIFMRGAP
jgi:hypothetical protein